MSQGESPGGAGLDDESRGINETGTGRELDIGQTTTSMTKAPPPLDQRPEKPAKFRPIIKEIDLFLLAGSSLKPEEELAAASRIWSQCGIYLEPTTLLPHKYDEAETRRLLATNGDARQPLSELTVVVDPDKITASMRNLRAEWVRHRKGQIAVFFAPKVFLTTNGSSSAVDSQVDIAYIGKPLHWEGWDVAHELGHLFIGRKFLHSELVSPLMHSLRPGNEIDEVECLAARGDHRKLIQRNQRLERRR
jgi:hypothetical protein